MLTKGKAEAIEHEILGVLKRAGMTITSFGSDAGGRIPLDARLISTSTLHYGTLVMLLNNPGYKPDPTQPTFINQVVTKKEDVGKNLLYDWAEVNDAIEVLHSNGDVSDERKGTWLDIEERRISLTESGLKTYNTKYYLKEYRKEQETSQLAKSTIRTNILVTLISTIILLCTIVTIVISYWQYTKPDTVSKEDFNKLLKAIQELKSQPVTEKTLDKSNDSLKKADVSFPTK